MRPKKDPGIRQDAFIRAALELFMEKGYEAVSIRDILDAVSDKTASPSVFYYYFSSKDALYRTCVETVAETYLSSLASAFSMDGKTYETWMLALISGMESALMSERNLIMTGNSTPNRLFVLDMRERTTRQVVLLWSESLSSSFSLPPADAGELAQFLAGGIGEMMFSFLLGGEYDRRSVFALSERILKFSMNTIGLPADQKDHLMAVLKEEHRRKSE